LLLPLAFGVVRPDVVAVDMVNPSRGCWAMGT
jgi:hypothetical protein